MVVVDLAYLGSLAWAATVAPAVPAHAGGGVAMEIEAVATSYRRWAPVYDATFGAFTRRAPARGRRGQPPRRVGA